MSDERLRSLERKWKESGSVEDEAAYLLEKVRVGRLSLKALKDAAFLGKSAAQTALGKDCPPAVADMQSWLVALQRLGLEIMLRSVIAGLELGLSAKVWTVPSGTAPRLVLDELKHCVRDMTDERQMERAIGFLYTLESPPHPYSEEVLVQNNFTSVLVRCLAAIQMSADTPDTAFDALHNCLLLVLRAFSSELVSPAPTWPDRTAESNIRLRFAIANDVGGWVLGYGDPLDPFDEPPG